MSEATAACIIIISIVAIVCASMAWSDWLNHRAEMAALKLRRREHDDVDEEPAP